MIHFIKSLSFFIILIVFSVSAFGQDQANVWSQVRQASPVFEEMLANQIASVRRKLIKDKLLQEESSFYVVGEIDEDKAFDRIIAYLNGFEPSVYWSGLFFSVSELSKAISLINEDRKETFIVMLAFKSDRSQWELAVEKEGLNLYDSISIPELEFVKDKAGRQIVNLNGSPYEYRIYERLVREGMNPVEAHPEAGKAIEKLKQMSDIQVLFFTKNFENQPKNLDLS